MTDSTNKFLDLAGLEYYDGKIKNYIDASQAQQDVVLTRLDRTKLNAWREVENWDSAVQIGGTFKFMTIGGEGGCAVTIDTSTGEQFLLSGEGEVESVTHTLQPDSSRTISITEDYGVRNDVIYLYIKTNDIDIPVESGIGENSIQAKGTGAQAISEGGVAFGYNTFAGMKGYYYYLDSDSTLVVNGVEKTSLTLKLTTAYNDTTAVEHGYEVGDVLCFVQNKKYDNKLTIDAITGNILTCSVTKTPSVLVENLPTDWEIEWDDCLVFCINKPTLGTADVGRYATAFGANNTVGNYCGFAAGSRNIITGQYGAAVGRNHTVSYASFASGRQNTITGWHSVSGGRFNTLSGNCSATFGENHIVSGNDSLVSGNHNIVSGSYGIVSGHNNKVYTNFNGVFGQNNIVNATKSLISGDGHTPSGSGHIIGGTQNSATGTNSLVMGSNCSTSGGGAYAGGYQSQSTHNNAHVHGLYLKSGGPAQTVVGRYNDNTANTDAVFVVGGGTNDTEADRKNVVAISPTSTLIYNNLYMYGSAYLNSKTIATEQYVDNKIDESIPAQLIVSGNATGSLLQANRNNKATKIGAIALGYNVEASGLYSFAFGNGSSSARGEASVCVASGEGSIALGLNCKATNFTSLASGWRCEASGQSAVAFGMGYSGTWNTASGQASFVSGRGVISSHMGSQALGLYTSTGSNAQLVCGQYNKSSSTARFQVGGGTGTANNARFTAFEVGNDYIDFLGTRFNASEIALLKQLLNNNLAEGSY